MPQLWVQCKSEGWGYVELHENAYSLGALPPRPRAGSGPDDDPILLRAGDGWLLVSGTDDAVLVNGLPIAGGIAALDDRDEVRVPAGTAFFSGERRLQVAAFAGRDAATRCPRCRLPIEPGTPAVVCTCGIAFHQGPERACWTFGATCTSCKRPTDLDRGFRWTPEDRG